MRNVCVCFLPDGVKSAVIQSRDMTEKQLLLVAKQLGKEWKQVAIYLDLNTKQLDEIQAVEKDVTMQKHKMLLEWKSRKQEGKATPHDLWESVKELDELPNEVYQTLKGNKLQTKTDTFGDDMSGLQSIS